VVKPKKGHDDQQQDPKLIKNAKPKENPQMVRP